MEFPVSFETMKDFASAVGTHLKAEKLSTYQNTMVMTTNDAGLTTLKLDLMQSFALALCVYYLGVFLKKKISVLEKFCIPAPVAGGIVFAVLHLIARNTLNFSIGIDTTFQRPFMMVFFTTIGMTASLQLVKKGGVGLVIFWILASVLCIFQDAVGVVIAKAMGQNPLLGLLCGSVTMTGGHGTGAAFAKDFTDLGMKGADVTAAAAATFGLVMGSIIGGPIGATLIKGKNLQPKKSEYTGKKIETEVADEKVDFNEIFKTLTYAVVAIAIGAVIEIPLKANKITLPSYVTAMIIASILLNVGQSTKKWHINQKCSELIGTISLNAFLAFALTGLKLWELAEVAGPMLVILISQTVLMAVFAYFITFKVMGSDFDAATIAAGHCGFGMGATPNGVANMTSVQERFGPAPRAFFILPVVGAFLIDFTNAMVITAFVNFVK